MPKYRITTETYEIPEDLPDNAKVETISPLPLTLNASKGGEVRVNTSIRSNKAAFIMADKGVTLTEAETRQVIEALQATLPDSTSDLPDAATVKAPPRRWKDWDGDVWYENDDEARTVTCHEDAEGHKLGPRFANMRWTDADQEFGPLKEI